MGEFPAGEPAPEARADASGTGPVAALLEAVAPLDEQRTRLLCSFAHQLRTPLTSALGFLELLADGSLGPLTAEQRRALDTVAGAVGRLSCYVDEIDPRTAYGPGTGSGREAAEPGRS